MLLRLYTFIIMGLLISSCGEDTSDLDVFFKLEYGDTPLVMLDEYEYPGGQTIKFTRFSFYLSDISVSDGSESQLIKDVDFLNLTNSHSRPELASTGYRLNLEDISIKDPTDVSFNIGVDPDLNATIPADYSGDHPLAKPGEYWIGWSSYIFFKIEGIMDTTGDGDTDTNIALHIGSDAMLRPVRIDMSESSEEIDININVKEIFENANGLYDITMDPQIHSLHQESQAEFLINNFHIQLQ